MAKNTGTSANENENTQLQDPEVDYKSANDVLQKQVDELKSMMAEFLQSQKVSVQSPKEAVSTVSYETDYEDVPMIPANKHIQVTSLFTGGMTVKGVNDKPIRFDHFGMTRPISYDDLTNVVSVHRNLVEDGSFFIHSKEAVKALYLEDIYSKMITKQTIENILELSDEEIRRIFNNTTQNIQETIVDLTIEGVKRHLKQGDMKYSNRNKIELLSELSGKDIYKIANDQLNDK
jgi:flagellar basal body P-ring protein FlgI